MQLSGSTPSLVALLAELRRAQRLGVPSWIAIAVRGCAEDLELLAKSEGEVDSVELRAQAQTLLQLCARFSRRVGDL